PTSYWYLHDNYSTLDIKPAPDGAIYILRVKLGHTFAIISKITQPNAAGLACGYVDTVFTMPTPWFPNLGLWDGPYRLGNNVAVYPIEDTTEAPVLDIDMNCIRPVTELISSEDALEYVWSTGATTKSMTIDKEGLYWVMNIHNCRVHIDSFRTQLADMGLDW